MDEIWKQFMNQIDLDVTNKAMKEKQKPENIKDEYTGKYLVQNDSVSLVMLYHIKKYMKIKQEDKLIYKQKI